MKGTILYLHPHFTLPGGAGRHALETGRELAKRGWQIEIASIRAEPELIKEFEPQIKFHTLGGPLSSSLMYWPHLPLLIRSTLKLIDTLRPDIVFSQVFPANWWGYLAKALRPNTFEHIWMCQEPSAFIHSERWIKALPLNAPGIAARIANPLLKKIDTTLARRVDYVFANSQFSRTLAITAYNYPQELLGICYPGVDTQRFSPDPTTKKQLYKLITCARLTRFKNIDKIIKALTLLPDPNVTLTVVGKGEELNSLLELTRQLKLSERVRFLQTISDQEMIHELRTSYALVHAAEEEPFGLTPVEAMACGTPVVAMQGGGPAETVLHQATGYLCKRATPEEIATAIAWLIQHKNEMPAISAACVEQAKNFTWSRAADALEQRFKNQSVEEVAHQEAPTANGNAA